MQACHAAYKRSLQAHQIVSCLPGTEAITEKARLFATLEAAYGVRLAAKIAPLSFTLPRQYFQLAQMVQEVGLVLRISVLALWVEGGLHAKMLGPLSCSSAGRMSWMSIAGCGTNSSLAMIDGSAGCRCLAQGAHTSWVLKEEVHQVCAHMTHTGHSHTG